MSAVLLVSHGQPSEPQIGEAEITAFGKAVQAHLPAHTVVGATLAGQGTLDAACAAHPNAAVYPMFMADGWFTRVQLRKRLGAHQGRVLAPFGTDPGLPGFAADWLRRICDDAGWAVPATEIVLTAHGSGRSPYPALDTAIFADALKRALGPKRLRLGFVEQAPLLVDALSGAGKQAICLPFFATRRGHVLEDLPEAVAASGFSGPILDPIGVHPDIARFVARAVQQKLDPDHVPTDQ